MNPRRPLRRIAFGVAGAVLAAVALAGCTESPNLGTDVSQGYVSGSGEYHEWKPADRKGAVVYTQKLDTGATLSSKSLLGKVYVLNFWYAGCAPCNSEAPILEKVFDENKGSVPFYGVNTYDAAPTAVVFEKTHKVGYPSFIDVNSGAVQYAFSQFVPADAVPTTLVIDRHGRVAARVTGEIDAASILQSLVKTVVAEGK